MSINEIDSHFAKCVSYLHASSKLRRGDPVPLQYVLEEVIKSKLGVIKDYTDLVQPCLAIRDENFSSLVTTGFEESKGSNSDNELELDLLKEDLMCVICNGMDVGARNRLVECSDCHSLYHQECHKPVVTDDSIENWICLTCKEANKKMKISTSSQSSTSKSSTKSSSRHSSTSYKSSSYSRSNDKCKDKRNTTTTVTMIVKNQFLT